MEIGVFLEPFSEEMADSLRKSGLLAFPASQPPRGSPEDLRALVLRSGIEGAVLIVQPASTAPIDRFTSALLESGIPPHALEIVRLPPGSWGREAMERARLMAFAAVERVRVQAEVDARHLKPIFTSTRQPLSRRDLMFGFFKSRYEVIPAVQADRCAAWKGCRLCAEACPREAISFRGGGVVLEQASCSGCGACVPACPQEAITSPRLSPRSLDAQLRALLSDEVTLRPRVLEIVPESRLSSTDGIPLPPTVIQFVLPCTAAISAWLLLRCFDRGADGVTVLPCGASCRHRCNRAEAEMTFAFVKALLGILGVEAERLQVVQEDETPDVASRLLSFVGWLNTLGAHRLQESRAADGRVRVADILKDRLAGSSFGRDVLSLRGTPFGIVKIVEDPKTCNLCGVCADHCPSGALALQEDAGRLQLIFEHAACVACAACVDACPDRLLSVRRALDLGLVLHDSMLLAEDRKISCQRCGKTVGSVRMVGKIRHLVQAGGLSGLRRASPALCPSCRIASGVAKAMCGTVPEGETP